jgi:hypothetical protein
MSSTIEIYGATVSARASDVDIGPAHDASRLAPWRCSVEKYHEMARLGILSAEDRVELLEGWIVEKMTKSPLDCQVARRLRRVLEESIPDDFFVITQDPVTFDTSEPEPDVVVVHGTPYSFGTRHPGPAEVVLVAEVSDSSLSVDKHWKRKIYANSAVPAYWIVNLVDRQVEVYTRLVDTAAGRDYAPFDIYKTGASVPLSVGGREIAIPVAAVLP